MRKFTFVIGISILLASPAQAQEQQVYAPYPTNTIYSESDLIYQQQMEQQMMQQMDAQGPSRDPYATFYGRMPEHPGDYRDAYDRGEFRGGASNIVPSRSFTIE